MRATQGVERFRKNEVPIHGSLKSKYICSLDRENPVILLCDCMWWSMKVGRSACPQVLKSVTGLWSPILLSFQQRPCSFPYQDEYYFLQPCHIIMEDSWPFRLAEIYTSTTFLGKLFHDYLNSIFKMYLLSNLNLISNSSWSDIACLLPAKPRNFLLSEIFSIPYVQAVIPLPLYFLEKLRGWVS